MKRALIPVVAIASLVVGTAAFTQSITPPTLSRKGPAQPINFSHQIHAGKLAMDCLYCHFGAEKSPVAGVPPVATCMGCHKLAVTDRPEIKKLAGYFERKEAVPWIKVHHLPDHVKFNHKRHVRAGVRCQTCHGPVETMPVVFQASSLKMGWCITCHRQNQETTQYAEKATMDCLVCHH